MSAMSDNRIAPLSKTLLSTERTTSIKPLYIGNPSKAREPVQTESAGHLKALLSRGAAAACGPAGSGPEWATIRATL